MFWDSFLYFGKKDTIVRLTDSQYNKLIGGMDKKEGYL